MPVEGFPETTSRAGPERAVQDERANVILFELNFSTNQKVLRCELFQPVQKPTTRIAAGSTKTDMIFLSGPKLAEVIRECTNL